MSAREAVRFIARGDREDGLGWVVLYDGDDREAAFKAATAVHAITELAHMDSLDGDGRVLQRLA